MAGEAGGSPAKVACRHGSVKCDEARGIKEGNLKGRNVTVTDKYLWIVPYYRKIDTGKNLGRTAASPCADDRLNRGVSEGLIDIIAPGPFCAGEKKMAVVCMSPGDDPVAKALKGCLPLLLVCGRERWRSRRQNADSISGPEAVRFDDLSDGQRLSLASRQIREQCRV